MTGESEKPINEDGWTSKDVSTASSSLESLTRAPRFAAASESPLEISESETLSMQFATDEDLDELEVITIPGRRRRGEYSNAAFGLLEKMMAFDYRRALIGGGLGAIVAVVVVMFIKLVIGAEAMSSNMAVVATSLIATSVTCAWTLCLVAFEGAVYGTRQGRIFRWLDTFESEIDFGLATIKEKSEELIVDRRRAVTDR
jgi:hypothetical protein